MDTDQFGDARGAGVILCDPHLERFLLQRKDALHPIPACRGLLSLFGGTVEEGETPREGLERELAEEILDAQMVAEVRSLLIPLPDCTLPRVQWPGEYQFYPFVAFAADGEMFTAWVNTILRPRVVTEGQPVLLHINRLRRILSESEGFVASLDQVMRSLLKSYVGDHVA